MADQPDPAAPVRVGIVGASPTRGWALSAHLPALAGLPGFTVTAVSTTRQETADETAATMVCSPRTVHKYWSFARRWLASELGERSTP